MQPAQPPGSRAPAQSWQVILLLFGITSIVETLGVSQIFAFLPLRLEELGLPEAEIPQFVGLFSSLLFVFGLPLVPLWGVWADKYSRKAVIIRSALVEAVVFAGVALAAEPWQLAVSLLLVGLQLGNTGVMLAALRDVTPRARLGTAIALFGAASPIGFALGPAIGGFMVDALGRSISAVFLLSAVLSLGVAIMLAVGSREVRPTTVPTGPVARLAYRAVVGAVGDPVTRRLFVILGTSFLATQMSRPFLPILVTGVSGPGPGQASAIALVVGTAALAGALVSPIAGAIGDRSGFRPVLVAALAGAGLALVVMPALGSVPMLAIAATALAAMTAAISAMVFGMLAVEVPAERRSATLNLVYLPLYVAGIVGPALGAVISGAGGVDAAFVAAGCLLLAGAPVVAVRMSGHRAPDA